LESALPALSGADLVVLLSHQDPSEVESLLTELDGVDLVVSGGAGASYAEPRPLPGGALLLASGSRGKKLGRASITLVPDASGFEAEAARKKLEDQLRRTLRRKASAQTQREEAESANNARGVERADKRLAYYDKEIAEAEAQLDALRHTEQPLRHRISHELVGLTVAVTDHPETAALLAAAKDEIEAGRTSRVPAPATVSAGPYVGSQVCAGCHPGPASQWSQTPHAHAWTTLVAQKRSQDLDCYSCHVTGAFHEAGPQGPEAVPVPLQGVGCEACHGPGRAHATNPGEASLVADPAEAVCTQCHDGVQDEGRFDFATYRARVVHGSASAGGGDP
jgi:predicted CXXCH cytochrome family protein